MVAEPLMEFRDLQRQYREQTGYSLVQIDASGEVMEGDVTARAKETPDQSAQRRLQAVEQTRKRGKAVIQQSEETGTAMWGVPVLDNNQLVGGLLVERVDLEDQPVDSPETWQRAADALLDLAIKENLINSAEMERARHKAQLERDRFLENEGAKFESVSDDLRGMYLSEEPALLSAIKGGHFQQARAILNRILTGIYGLAGERLEMLKSCILELVVMMSRAAVEAGAEPDSVLGSNYRSLVELAEIDDEEDLSEWLRDMLEIMIERIHRNDAYPHTLLLNKAVSYMKANLHQQLRRDDVARIAGVSPSHFSKLMTERMGRSFSQLLTQMRVNRAREMLLEADHTLSEIALDCGFCDQSHFNKTFKAATTVSPSDYRKSLK